MEFIEQLKKLGLFKPEMDILDIGCRNGWLWERLQKPGRHYDAIDMIDMLDDKTGIRFQQTSFTDFVPDKQYDLIFANLVFFFDPDQVGQAKRYIQYLKPGGIMCVTFMATDDPHVGRKGIDGTTWYGISQNETEKFTDEVEVLWFQDFREQAPDYGDTMRSWHLYYYMARKVK